MDQMQLEALALVGVLALYNTNQISEDLADRVIDAVTTKWGEGVTCDKLPEEMAVAFIQHLES